MDFSGCSIIFLEFFTGTYTGLQSRAICQQIPYEMLQQYCYFKHILLVAGGFFRQVTTDVKVGDFILPAGDTVVFHLDSVHRDPDCWQNADAFQPERWLDEEGNVRTPSAYFPFGSGRQ